MRRVLQTQLDSPRKALKFALAIYGTSGNAQRYGNQFEQSSHAFSFV